MSNVIRWYKSAEMDAPELNSPQPCKRGIHCNYMVKNEADEWEPGCCRGVHPGEEGTGRRIFPARITEDGREQSACVRLTGRAGYYERRRLRLSWSQWCEREGIPFTPAPKEFEPVTLVACAKRDTAIQAAMELCQPYMRERHPMQEHASIGGSTAFGLNPRAFDVMAQQHAERSLDPRMMSRGFLGMPGGAEAARVSAGSEQRSKTALKNARKRANKKAAASAAAAQAAVQAAAATMPQPYIHSSACLRHSAQRPLAWGPEAEGGCLCAGIRATQAANRAVAAGLRPACQPYEGMSCAYGGFDGCVYCRISCEELEAGLLAAARRPSNIDLSSGGAAERFAVRGRGGECSPDCCCPTGLSCHDRTIPDENCEGGCCSPQLTAIVCTGDFESLD
jgi:hypothetical protein